MNTTLYITSIVIHVITAVFWIGSMLFMTLILIPSLKAQQSPGLTGRMIMLVGRRYKLYGWASLVILLLTGLYNLYARGISHAMLTDPVFWSSPFGKTLGWKIILFVVVIILSVIHDGIIGPRYRITSAEGNSREKTAERYRLAASWMGRLTLLISLIIAILAVMLVRGIHW